MMERIKAFMLSSTVALWFASFSLCLALLEAYNGREFNAWVSYGTSIGWFISLLLQVRIQMELRNRKIAKLASDLCDDATRHSMSGNVEDARHSYEMAKEVYKGLENVRRNVCW